MVEVLFLKRGFIEEGGLSVPGHVSSRAKDLEDKKLREICNLGFCGLCGCLRISLK